MATTGLNAQLGMFGTREDYLLPLLNTALSGNYLSDTKRIKYLGDDFSLVQGVEVDISGLVITITQNVSAGYGSAKVLEFSKGNLSIENAILTGPVTMGANSGASEALLTAVGHAAADSTVALASNEVTVIPSASTTIAARVGTVTNVKTSKTFIDGTGTAASIYINVGQAANVGGASSATFGTGARLRIYYTQTETYDV